MSSSTSSSDHRRFLLWVTLALVVSYVVVQAIPWGGVSASKRSQRRAASELAGDTEFLIMGDSKAGPFSVGCLAPWLLGHRGLVFSADSVTPVFHYDNLLQIRRDVPEFAPGLVLIFVGANNFNANGLHVEREYTFFNDLALSEAWDLSARHGEYLLFASALISRVLPLYGKRVPITHLQIGDGASTACSSTDPGSFASALASDPAPGNRKAVLDRNYLDIYRRSVYSDYVSSPLVVRATEKLIAAVREYGGTPILVMPPVTPDIRALEHQLIGEAFDQTIAEIAARTGTQVLDLRDEAGYEFADVNHLSPRGARDLVLQHFRPLVEAGNATAQAAAVGGGLAR